jgi:RHH-type rel operon transcriptional repressor/antitoxin RelB
MTDRVTVRLDAQTRKRLDKLAKATERSRTALAVEAIKQFIELNEWRVAAIEEGVREAQAGRFLDDALLKAKWEKRLVAAKLAELGIDEKDVRDAVRWARGKK